MAFKGLVEPRVKSVQHWRPMGKMPSKNFTCGYCDNLVSSENGIDAPGAGIGYLAAQIYICPSCGLPTYFDNTKGQLPHPKFGSKIDYLPKPGVEELYNEARINYASQSYTSAVLSCRKILMNVGVDQGGNPNEKFAYYVDYLNNNHYIPPGGRQFIDKIRTLGNEATHEIQPKSEPEAKLAIYFTEILLKNIYEAPGKLQAAGIATP